MSTRGDAAASLLGFSPVSLTQVTSHIGVLLFLRRPTERELTERQIKARLRGIMMQKDLENVTCKEVSAKCTYFLQ